MQENLWPPKPKRLGDLEIHFRSVESWSGDVGLHFKKKGTGLYKRMPGILGFKIFEVKGREVFRVIVRICCVSEIID